ncbi:hypothetical protein ASG36_07105 [Geodermatophilus sp. Leaf369]|uniref:hypothetical protein n=1 Tax=Geodermatophilus sp. Leaf369 TaxID=1736354 RepID=UPI0006FBA873|nr:hypothetical protein [Geodermatophilus sp. Leaf369]KQS60647.1 hypothetical protein ASG36_07105 [Geodermatophilus sp. Leaf369]
MSSAFALTDRARLRPPVPKWAWRLGVVVVGLEVVGFLLRVLHAPRWLARPLSMELPFSAPRLVVAAVFAGVACAALSGAIRMRGRRTWWTAVAGVAGLIAVVKAGSVVHKAVLEAIDGYAHPVRALAFFGVVAAAGIAWLWWLSRHDRRDRRRVLTWLAVYAGASVGLSTVSGVVETALGHGHPLTAAAALVEESTEGIAGVGFLLAVLLGVAPKLVLPAGWTFRRQDDEGSPEPVEADRRTQPRS